DEDRATMMLDQPLADGEAQAGALVLLHQSPLALDEGLEQLAQHRLGNAGPLVAHPEADEAVLVARAHRHCRAVGAELERVGEEVEEDLLQLGAIGAHPPRALALLDDAHPLRLRYRRNQRAGPLDLLV